MPRLSGLIETEFLFEAGFEANTNSSLFVTSFGACLFDLSLCSVWPVALLMPAFAEMMLGLLFFLTEGDLGQKLHKRRAGR